jgi:hypothetical protein
MKRILLGLLFLSGTVAAQENDKSIAILGGPSDLWTNNRLILFFIFPIVSMAFGSQTLPPS